LLDFYNTVFERDYVEFAMRNSLLENAIQNFMERSLSQMSSIDKQARTLIYRLLALFLLCTACLLCLYLSPSSHELVSRALSASPLLSPSYFLSLLT
jgi:hypothetical protein